VDLPGGTLTVGWDGKSAPMLMKGPAVSVFEGEIEL
jgi:diaminopimelate epimerase